MTSEETEEKIDTSHDWAVDNLISYVRFQIKHLGMVVKGFFSGLNSQILIDEANLINSKIKASVDAVSINTQNLIRDMHLRMTSYLHVSKNPLIKFESLHISKEEGIYYVVGNLTIKKTTKQIKIPFRFIKEQNIVALTGKFALNRLDFNVGSKNLLIANEVLVEIKCALRKFTP